MENKELFKVGRKVESWSRGWGHIVWTDGIDSVAVSFSKDSPDVFYDFEFAKQVFNFLSDDGKSFVSMRAKKR